LRGSGQPSLVWVSKIFPKNPKISIFALQVKKISLGQVKKYPGQSQMRVIFLKKQM